MITDNAKGIDFIKNMPEAIRNILENRGIGEEDYSEFFSPKPTLAYDPFLLTNMREGVDLLLEAIDSGSRIVIYGDYDVDGVTSTSLMMKVIGSLTDNVTYYIPSRLDEGYGLHKESIDRIFQDGGELIVTVDCGSVSREETEYAHSLGIETLVTDHHNVSDVRAEGIVINPRLAEDQYPFKGLAGVGVAYKLALALSREREIPKAVMSELLELVTIGTIADIMPVLGENRTIIKFGLRFIHLGCRNKGLRRLIELSGLDYKTLKSTDISFGIAPKINAAGRLGDATLGVKLLLAEDEDEIENYCSLLIDANQTRKTLQDNAYEASLAMIDRELALGDFLMLEINDSHEGVLGIVAGKVREDINRPVVVVSRNGENYKGTGRSIPGVDMFQLLDKYRSEFISFGGHSAACGFTIAAEKMAELKENLNQDIARLAADNQHLFDEVHNFDTEVDIEDASLEMAELLEQFEPFGKGNEIPVFLFRNVRVQDWKFLKNDTKYARFSMVQESGQRMGSIIFRDALKFSEVVENNELVDVLGNIDINRWNGSSRVQVVASCILPAGEI